MTKIILTVATVVLLINAIAATRDYQDSWVLEDVEITFVLFMTTYAVAFFSERKEKSLVIMAVICCVVRGLVPSLKYTWFIGREIDQQGQYMLAEEVYATGYIATEPFGGHGRVYVDTPLLHLALASFSAILGIPITWSMKFLPVVWLIPYPLLTYSLMKKIGLPNGATATKYALFISSIAVSGYIITGRTLGTLLAFFAVVQIPRLLKNGNRRHWGIFLFFVFVLSTAHSVSSVLFTLLIVAIAVLQKLLRRAWFKKLSFAKMDQFLGAPAVFTVLMVSSVWLSFSGGRALYEIVQLQSNLFRTTSGRVGVVPTFRLFELISKNFAGAIGAVAVYHGADILLLLFTLIGLIFVFKTSMGVFRNRVLKFLFLFNALLLVLLVLGLSLNLGQFFWVRITNFLRISFPLFSAIAMLYFIKQKALLLVIFMSIMLLTTLQSFGCQPLIPPASTISEDLPNDEPVVYCVQINSVYQREMISFAERHVDGRLASDRATRAQMVGLTGYNFSRRHIWYYPIASVVDETVVKREYEYFLIHLPGKSGAFGEQAELRTKDLIIDFMNNSTVVYTNGESFVCVPYRAEK